MNKTSIEWVKNPKFEWTDDSSTIHVKGGDQGYTWNPITGCLNGCEYCYARKLANGRLKPLYLANKNIAPIGTMIVGAAMGEKALRNPFYPRFWPERLDGFSYDGKPKGIFVCDMSDLFGIGIPKEWQEWVFSVIRFYPQHRFYLLTKQPQNLIKWSPFPDNCWVGVTATDNASFHLAIRHLQQVEAKVKYLSIEPFLEEIYTGGIIGYQTIREITLLTYKFIDLIIIGAQTKPYKPPKIEWVEEIVQACDKAGVPVFLKNNLIPLLKSVDYVLPTNIAMGAYLRQEMPATGKE